MNGDGARAGLKQVIAERKQADLGASGLGRLAVSAPTATSVRRRRRRGRLAVRLQACRHQFNTRQRDGVRPDRRPAAVSVDLTGLPNDGDSIQFRFTLPDGTSESITLTATTSANPGPGPVHHRRNASATAANLQAALTTSLGKLASTSLGGGLGGGGRRRFLR